MAYSSTAIDVPNHNFSNMTMRLVSKVAQNTGTFGYKTQQYNYEQQRWEAEVTLAPMSQDDAREWMAFFAKLDGTDGKFNMAYPSQRDSVTVETSATKSVGSDTINWRTKSGGYTLKAGKYFSLTHDGDKRLYMALEETGATSSSNTELKIRPNLRAGVVADLDMRLNQPEGVWRLASPQFEFDINTAEFHGFTFACVEAL